MANKAEDSMLTPLRKLFAAEQYKQLSDEQLLQCFIAQREEGAVAALMKRHGPMVLGVARAVLRHTQDAEDVCQACFLLLARKSGSIRKRTSVACWLHGVAYRMAKKLAASKHRHPHKPIDEPVISAPADDVSWREVRLIVHEELERLPQKYRKPLILCYLEGHTQDEAAQQLGCSGGALKGMLTRGRDLLKRRLTQRGLGSAALLATPLANETLAAGLVKATASSAILLLSGKALGAGISAQAGALFNGGLKGMLMTKLKVMAAVVLCLAATMAGVGVAGFRPGTANQPIAGQPGSNKKVPLAQALEGQAKAKDLPQDKAQQPRAVDALGDPLPKGASARLGSLRWRHTSLVDFAAFSPDGKSVVSADTEAIRMWEFPSGLLIRSIDLPLEDDPSARALKLPQGGALVARFAALSNDGKTVACFFREKNKLLCYEVATGKLLSEATADGTKFLVGPGAVNALVFSPNDEELATFDAKGVVHIWNWRKGVKLRSLGTAAKAFGLGVQGSAMAYSPDGKAIAVIRNDPDLPLKGARHLQIWNVATGAAIRGIPIAADTTTYSARVAWSPESKTLAYSGADTIFLLDAATGKEVSRLSDEQQLAGGAMIFSKDGKKLYARGTNFRAVAEWDVATAKLSRTLGGEPPFQETTLLPGKYRGMSLSPDGTTLVLDDLERVPQFIDLRDGKEITLPGGNIRPVVQLQFSPDNKTLLTLANNTNSPFQKSLRKWDFVTGKQLNPMVLPETTAQFSASPDGQTLAVAVFSDGRPLLQAKQASARVVLIDSSTGKVIREIAKGQPAIAFSNDGKMLALHHRQQGQIELCEPSTGKLLRSWVTTGPVPQDPKTDNQFSYSAITLFFSQDGKKLGAFSDPAALIVWDTSTGKRIGAVPTPKDAQVLSVAISPEGRTVVFGLDDGTAALYDVTSGQRRLTFGEKPPAAEKDNKKLFGAKLGYKAVTSDSSGVAFSPDGKLVAQGGLDKVVHLWDAATGKSVAEFPGHTGKVLSVAFSPDGRWLASGSADTTTLIWDLRPPR